MTWAFIIDSVEFSEATILGQTSLGGSESSCLGLARALASRGHQVHLFTTKLADGCSGKTDHAKVTWHAFSEFRTMNQFLEWDVVVSLRMYAVFAYTPVYARLRLLWNQDLLVPGQMQAGVMGVAWALDHLCYVSEYHRHQWEGLQPELKPLGWVTRNGYEPAHLPAKTPTKDPNRIIHISRPERGLGPLLQMWPALKAKQPDALLHICRYSSMYDTGPGSWSDVCRQWDERVHQVNADTGGITYLGELTKPQLYQAISEAAVMWYPGVATFGETNCIAALEAAACGTPFVGSYRGALPETSPTGILIRGDAERDASYHQASVQAVSEMLDQCRKQSFDYRRRQRDGMQEASLYTFARLAEQWEVQVESWFRERYEGHTLGVLRQLLHEDDHVAAKVTALGMLSPRVRPTADGVFSEHQAEAARAVEFCNRVIAGQDHTAEQYGRAALEDPLEEAAISGRFKAVIPHFEKATHVLDVACGNGAFAIALLQANPTVRVHGIDYSPANIERAKEAADRAGVGDRCTFAQATIYDFEHQELCQFEPHTTYDGMFVGEFIEHCANVQSVIDGLERLLQVGARVVYTCPHGPYAEIFPRNVPLYRGHVHHFHHDDIKAVWGQKLHCGSDYVVAGMTERGHPLGNWIIHYTVAPNRPAGCRPLQSRIERTRPLQKLSVGILTKNVENDIARCLSSIYTLADEIVIGDTGSKDTTLAIVDAYGPKIRRIDLDPIEQQPEGFAGARNQVLQACTGEWFLWIDADEVLINCQWVRRYLESSLFNGYVVHQNHLYIDAPPTFDPPVRLFRKTEAVRFYGCVHEQPQDGDPNTDLSPILDIQDVQLAHFGYLTQDGREDKRVHRNLPLLMKDQHVFPSRILGQVLLLREAVIQSDAHRAQYGELTPRAQQGYAHALKIFLQHFDDPAHKYHKLARPWYEAALQHLGIGWEQEIALAGKQGGLGRSQARPERVWVRDAAEYRRVLAYMVDGLAKGMEPATFVTDPDVFTQPAVQREEVSA